MKTQAALWIVAAATTLPALAMAAGANLRPAAPPQERQVELDGPIRSFSQDATTISIRLSNAETAGPRRISVTSAHPGGAAISANLRSRQLRVTLQLPAALASSDALTVTVADLPQ